MSTPQESATLAGSTTSVRTLQIYVGGRWVDSTAKTTFDVHNPALDTVIARTPMGGAEDVDRAVTAALKAFPAWRATPPVNRVRFLFTLKNLFEKAFEDLARTIAILYLAAIFAIASVVGPGTGSAESYQRLSCPGQKYGPLKIS